MTPRNHRLYRFARWLIGLRWLGGMSIILVTFVSSRILNIGVKEYSLYMVAGSFLLLNALHYILLRKAGRDRDRDRELFRSLRWLINFQVSSDFLVLTLLLHFSGGIENPFLVYFLFHMIMASIVLSPAESYLQAGFAWALVIMLVLLEYKGILPHHPLTGFGTEGLYRNGMYILGTGFVFITTSFLVVYITNNIVSQSRRNEAAYMKANLELEKKDEIKNEYVLRITHDIKGHLAAIKSSLDVLYSKPEGSIRPDCQEFIDMASHRTSVLIRFVKDLLHITRLKLSSEIRRERFSIRDSIKKIADHMAAPAREKSIRIHLDLEDSVDQVSGLQVSIEELIGNLLGNALQYSSPGSDVYLRASILNRQVRIEIEDSGPGIPAGEQELVFEEFYRGVKTRAGSEGSGLGLAISRKIVQTHGGRIWIESDGNLGTTFCFTLPQDPPART
jgi:signal transduction histidine kinase